MTWPADYHMHTPLCRHATGEPTEFAAQALRVGLTEIGFSDHSPMLQDDFDDWRMRLGQLDAYLEKVEQARRDHPTLRIKIGLEVDYLPGQEEWIRELAARHPWDYLIGSVHYISDGWVMDNPNQISEWRRHDIYTVWSMYFQRLALAAQSGLFDIIGHADLAKKFGFIPTRDCTPIYQDFLKAARASGVAVELNTGGLRKDCKEIYPGPALVALLKEHEIPITFGSDAHAPEEVGMNFAEAVQLARASGYRDWCSFTARQRSTHAL